MGRTRWIRHGVLVAAVAVGTMVMPVTAARSTSDATTPPLRQGTIVGGPDTMGSMPCGIAPDCAAWLQSGCSPALAGVDPALFTSIVDVAALADGTTLRAFSYSKVALWSGVTVQFWDGGCAALGDCMSLPPQVPAHDSWWFGLDEPFGCRGAEIAGARPVDANRDSFTTFAIPSGAAWMTVSGSAAIHVRWTLRTADPIVEQGRADLDGACDEFPGWNEAQVRYERLRSASGDGRELDPDGDGVPCGGLDGAPANTQRPSDDGGYLMAESNGTVFGFGDLRPLRTVVTEPTVGLAIGPDGGYWLLAASGDVHSRGVPYHGRTTIPAGDRAAAIAGRPDGTGYWVFTARGRVLPRGTARNLGDLGDTRLNSDIIAAVATPSGDGYWMVGADGGIFSFGDAVFFGSTGDRRLNEPVVGMAADPDGRGYWLVAADGGIFAFEAPFRGSVPGVLRPGQKLNRPVIGAIAYGDGYLMVAADGGTFSFSNKSFHGSLGSTPPPNPIVGVAAR